jgi:hypothetical protein
MGSKQNQEWRKGIIEPGQVERTRRALELEVVTLQLELVVLQQNVTALWRACDDGSATRKVA